MCMVSTEGGKLVRASVLSSLPLLALARRGVRVGRAVRFFGPGTLKRHGARGHAGELIDRGRGPDPANFRRLRGERSCVVRAILRPVVSRPAEILPTSTPSTFRAAVLRAVEALRAGEVVALPTETVYGLAANALDPDAVAKIFEIKARPAHNPIIVHVASIAMAQRCVSAWPDSADRIVRAFWPGPLTIVLPRSASIPDVVTAGGSTVGVRWSSHPFLQEVIEACGFPLAAPSANPSNRLSPTTAEHVRRSLGDRLQLVVDGGPSQVGIESTVLDLSSAVPRVLRPGTIHEESLAAALGEAGLQPPSPPAVDEAAAQGASTLRSPGLLRKHYSPKAPLRVLAWRDAADLRRQLHEAGLSPDDAWVLAHTRVPSAEGFAGLAVIPHEPDALARALYAELHRLDVMGARLLVIEAVPESPEWRGIRDRLARASAE